MPIRVQKLRIEGDVFGSLDQGMFLEEVVVAIGEIGAVMAAAAFFACESGTGHERCERVEVREFVIVAGGMAGFRKIHSFQGCYGGRKFFAAA